VGLTVTPVGSRADRRRFVDLPWTLYADDQNWRPPLKSDVHALIGGPDTNPWFLHARARFFLARRDGVVVGRISAQVCDLVQERRPGLGQWGLFETVDDSEVALALIRAAEDWLRGEGMTRAQGPISISIWDEPGLLVAGFDTPPRVMMGHHLPWYERHVLAAGYAGVKDLQTWSRPVHPAFPDRINRIVEAGEKNPRIRIRELDMSRYMEEAALLLDLLNDAWSQNWGFVPLTPAEIAYVGRKLKPVAFPHMVRIAEYDGEAVGFMIAIPDINELTRDLDGRLLPFGWAKLLWRLRKARTEWFRVPLMGIRPKLQGSRAASLMAFMMIERIRQSGVRDHGAKHAEIGWILDDNGPMIAIAQAIEARPTRIYRIYEADLPKLNAALANR
jgi:hypothetical protein